MNLIEKIRLIERIDALIRRKGTGSPKDLSRRLDVSERYIYKILNLMKEMGAPIYYCVERQSYCYKYEIEFAIGFIEKQKDLIKIKGGIQKYHFFYHCTICSVSGINFAFENIF